MESDDHAINPFLVPVHDSFEYYLAEQSEIEKEVKLSCLLQLDDTFSTEDRWPF